MATEKKLILSSIENYFVMRYLEKNLERAGVSHIAIQKTPVATRIELTVQRPGIVVGKRGSSISELAEKLKTFGIDNPKIEVLEVAVPSLDAKLMAEKIGRFIETRGNVKQAIRVGIREIMSAGAIGAEIRVSGKVVGKGGKAKALTARSGYLKKSGDPIKLVRQAQYTIYPKAGAIGITVRILPPGVKLPDKIKLEPKPTEKIVLSEPDAPATVEDAVAQATLEPAVLPDAAPAAEAEAEAEEKPKKKRVSKKAAPKAGKASPAEKEE